METLTMDIMGAALLIAAPVVLLIGTPLAMRDLARRQEEARRRRASSTEG